MSWFLRLTPIVMVCACGGTTVTREGDGGAAGGNMGSGGKAGSGGQATHEPMKHRPTAVACGEPMGGGGAPNGASPDPVTCVMNTDCTSGPNGRCIGGRIGLHCVYDQCFTDDVCRGGVCECGTALGEGSHCLAAGCLVDADCPESFCSPTFGTCGAYSGVVSYQCHTQFDECVDDSDCTRLVDTKAGGGPGYCAYDPKLGHWACGYTYCAG
jgi:hypothetical protein